MPTPVIIREEHFLDSKQSPSFFRISSRKRGYDPLTAIAEPLDNSTENNIRASVISCYIGHNKAGRATKILVVDNGLGMTYEQLVSAMQFGCRNAYKDETTIGYNGVGFKEAGLYFGQRVEVWTKTLEGEMSYGVLDTKCPNGSDAFTYPVTRGVYQVSEFGGEFKLPKVVSTEQLNSMTIVQYEIERNAYQTYSKFSEEIVNMISVRYSFYMKNTFLKYFVHTFDEITGKSTSTIRVAPKILYLNGQLLGEGSIDINGIPIRYQGYYIPRVLLTGYDVAQQSPMFPIQRNGRYRGCNFIRNGVVITASHAVDMKTKYDTPEQQGTDVALLNCFRFVVYANANADLLFNVGSNKVLGKFESWDYEVKKTISDIITPMVAECVRLESNNVYENGNNVNSIFDSVTKIINRSKDFQSTIRKCVGKLSNLLGASSKIHTGEGSSEDVWASVRKRSINSKTKKREKGKTNHDDDTRPVKENNNTKQGGGESDNLTTKIAGTEISIIRSHLGKSTKLHNEQPIVDNKLTIIVNEDHPLYNQRYPSTTDYLSEQIIRDSTINGIAEICAKLAIKQELGDDYSDDQVDKILTTRDDIYSKLIKMTNPFSLCRKK